MAFHFCIYDDALNGAIKAETMTLYRLSVHLNLPQPKRTSEVQVG